MAFNTDFQENVEQYFFGEADANDSFFIIQVTKVKDLAVQFNLVLPQNREGWKKQKSVGPGALLVDFADGVENPVKIHVGSTFQPLSSTNLKDFVIYVSDIIFDYAGLDAQAVIDRQDKEQVTNPKSRESLSSVVFLNSAKRDAVESILNSFFKFVFGLDNELLGQLEEMNVFSPEQIQSIYAQGVGNRQGGVGIRLFTQRTKLLGAWPQTQREFNSILDTEYPKLLGPIEETKETEPVKEIEVTEEESNTTRNVLIASGIIAAVGIGVYIHQRNK